jgi:GT2 family glycosyltransferase/tetratricopeptide (TPR) repeat protein
LRACIASYDFVGPVRNGGVGTAFTSLGEALAAAGHEVTFLYLSGTFCENGRLEDWIAHYRAKGIAFVPMPEIKAPRLEAPFHAAKSCEAWHWLRGQSFDVIHFSEWRAPGFYSLIAKRQGLAFGQTTLCVHTHGPTLWSLLSNGEYLTRLDDVELDHMERASVRLADVLVSPSQYLLRWMQEQGWSLPEKTCVEQYVQPASASAPATPPPAEARPVDHLVFFGRLEVRKGLELFCDALDRLKDDPDTRRLRVTFLGKITEVNGRDGGQYLKDRARQWPWKWEIVSNLDQPGAIRLLRAGGVLALMPSLADNLPNTVLECLGARVPFLTSDIGGIPEMVAPEDRERTCLPLRAAAFAERIRQCVREGARPARPAVDPAETLSAWLSWHDGLAHAGPALSATALGPRPGPRVSVCLSHFNRPDYLRQALASLEAQDYPNFEVVLVDDASTKPEAVAFIDSLEEKFRQRDWQLLRNRQELFVGAARNLAARHARGEYLLFMDDDNVAKPEEISTFVRVAQRTNADILTCFLDFFSGREAPKPGRTPDQRFLFLGDAVGASACRNCLGDTNAFIRREVFLALGGFHEERGVGHEDWELYAGAVLRGHRLEVVPEALVWYRRNEAEMSATRKNSLHRGHMHNIQPYLDAVPAALRTLVLLVQGQFIKSIQGDTPSGVPQAYIDLTIQWRSLHGAARVLLEKADKPGAVRLLMDALQAASASPEPKVVLEALLAVGQEMIPLDTERARVIASLASDLARKTNNRAGLAVASQLEARLGQSAPASTTPAIAPRAAVPARAVPPRAVAGGVPSPATPAASPACPRASIVIPTFNNLDLTRRCLAALTQHTPAGLAEIIVVDNASTDGTADFLRAEHAAGRLRATLNAANFGFARACNQGALEARGTHVIFLNNDTEVTAGWLEAMLAAAQAPEAGAVGIKLLYPDGTVQHAGIGFINGIPDHPFRNAAAAAPEVNQPREMDMVTGACLLLPRDLFLELGGFDESYRNGVEDIDLCLRARAAGRKVLYEPKAVVVHHEGRSVGRFDHVNENLQIFFRRWQKSFDAQGRFLAPKQRRVVRAEKSLISQSVSAAWEGGYLDLGSLSHVNREMTRQLARQSRVQLACVGRNALPPALGKAPGFRKLARQLQPQAPRSVQVTVRHAWPPDWQAPASGAWVLMQPWEYGALPAEWVRNLERVTEAWVPSEFVRRCYVESGVDPAKVRVVPNGIDPQRFRPEAKPLPLATKKSFKFLFVGGTIHRKGPDVLLQAFLDAFTAADDVCLVIKDFGAGDVYAGQTAAAQIQAAQTRPNAPEILHLTRELAPEEMAGLYTACDCLAHPYRGEGFGLPVLEAMACGLPVIVTGGGATDDFATDDFAWRLPSRRVEFGDSVSGMKLAGPGWMLEPDAAALAERMKWMVAHRDEARAKGHAASRHVRAHWTWENAARIAADRLRLVAGAASVVASTTAPAPAPAVKKSATARPIELPACARLGHLGEARERLRAGKLVDAWQATAQALRVRPFHPEGWLLFAEIARAAGDPARARQCAEIARRMAPGWPPAQRFLKEQTPKSTARKAELPPLPELPLTPRLSVCLIVKNEEQFIGQCLESIRDLAEQIVVVDTGSTDWTRDIAQRFGAEVHAFEWRDDFSAARNFALEKATGDWVLVLDADEELPPDERAKLAALLRDDAALAWRLRLINRGHEDDGISYVPRLFRNAPGLFYVGRVHEQVFSSVEVRRAEWGLENKLGDATLLHHGYTQEMTAGRDKIARNLRLLRLAVEELPGDPNLLMNLGLELARDGQHEAGLEQYREAFRALSALPAEEVVPELRETLLTQFAGRLMKAKRFEEIVSVLDSKLAQRGGLTASMHFQLGLAHLELRQHAPAAAHLRECLARRDQPALSPVLAEIRGGAPHHCLAVCLAALNQFDEAATAFEAARAASPQSRAVRFDYARFLAQRNQPVEALQLLHELVDEKPEEELPWRLGGQIALSRPDFLEFAGDWTGEAVKARPEDGRIIEQRAEALLLSGRTAEALLFWQKLSPTPLRQAAAILCQIAEGRTAETAEAEAVSREFLKWYRRLLEFNAGATVRAIGGRLDALRAALPAAAQVVQAALAEAGAAAA